MIEFIKLCRFKNFQFDRASPTQKALAEKYLHANFVDYWSPDAATQHNGLVAQRVAIPKQTRRRSSGLVGCMLEMGIEEDESESSNDDERMDNVFL